MKKAFCLNVSTLYYKELSMYKTVRQISPSTPHREVYNYTQKRYVFYRLLCRNLLSYCLFRVSAIYYGSYSKTLLSSFCLIAVGRQIIPIIGSISMSHEAIDIRSTILADKEPQEKPNMEFTESQREDHKDNYLELVGDSRNPEACSSDPTRWAATAPDVQQSKKNWRSAFEPSPASRKPQPLGIPWLDSMLGGGLADGEVFLFLAPTGCGKTTLATQIAWSRAMQQSHTVYITYNEPLEGHIDNRFCSLMTGIPRPDFEKRAIADMSPDIQRRFQAWREAYGGFLHLYDGGGATRQRRHGGCQADHS